MQPSSVDFPAPFGPIRHVSDPRSTASVTSSTAATAPNDFVAPRGLGAPRAPRLSFWGPRGPRRGGPPGAVSVVGRCVYCLNAVPNTATGLHEAIRPAHMLAIWMPLWLRGPK